METLIFLCNGEADFGTKHGVIENSKLPGLIKTEIEKGKPYQISWSCWNSRFIQVGDRAYLQRSGNMGNEPSGFIAAGYVMAAPENEQLRLLNKSKYSDLSAAYVDDYYGRLYVHIEIDSVVDFDFPLEQKYLKKLSEFQGVNFNFGRGGARFNSKAASFLDSEWEKYSLIQQGKNHNEGVGLLIYLLSEVTL
jgi:hypothetical protein